MRWLYSITDSVDIKSEQTPRNSEEQGSLVCCSPWGHEEFTMTWQLNSNNKMSWIDFLKKDVGKEQIIGISRTSQGKERMSDQTVIYYGILSNRQNHVFKKIPNILQQMGHLDFHMQKKEAGSLPHIIYKI